MTAARPKKSSTGTVKRARTGPGPGGPGEPGELVGPGVHHHVYVVYLRNPRGDGKAAYYVGMTGLTPAQRFENHKQGIKSARVVRRFGERLVPRLYAHLNPMPYAKAQQMEAILADSLRKRGFVVYGGH